MEKQNVTLSISKRLLKRAKHIAVEEGTSLSGLLNRFLEQIVYEKTAHHKASARFRRRLKKGFDLGTGGKCDWDRDEIHER